MRSKSIRALIATAILVAVGSAPANAQRVADIAGFHFGAALNGTSIELDETSFTDDDSDTGIGANLYVGYNFTRNLGLTLGGTFASIDTDDTEDYSVTHFDLAGRFSFPGRSAFVPYLELALTQLAVEFDANGQEVEVEGFGFGGGVGFNYFFSRLAAFDASFRYTIADLDDIEINGQNAGDIDDLGVNTMRLNLGIAIYP